MEQVLSFIKVIVDSNIAQTVAPPKGGGLSDDMSRMELLLKTALDHENVLKQSDLEAVETAKNAMLKNKGAFQASISIYPLGVFVCDVVSRKVTQCKQDAILTTDLEGAADYAKNMKNDITKDTIMKERDGDWDIVVPNQQKFAEMVAKAAMFQEKASQQVKSDQRENLDVIQSRVDQLHDSMAVALRMKYEKKFTNINDLFTELAGGVLDSEKVTNALATLAQCASYQPCAKIPLAKLLGKSMGGGLEEKTSSVASLCDLTKVALPKLCSLATGSCKDDNILMERCVVAVFTTLCDAAVVANILGVLPSWEIGLAKLTTMIQNGVRAFMTSATATFHSFIVTILEPNIQVDCVLKSSIVGSVDHEDNKDFSVLFASFVRWWVCM